MAFQCRSLPADTPSRTNAQSPQAISSSQNYYVCLALLLKPTSSPARTLPAFTFPGHFLHSSPLPGSRINNVHVRTGRRLARGQTPNAMCGFAVLGVRSGACMTERVRIYGGHDHHTALSQRTIVLILKFPLIIFFLIRVFFKSESGVERMHVYAR